MCVCSYAVGQTDVRQEEKQGLVPAFLSPHTTGSSDRLLDISVEALRAACVCHTTLIITKCNKSAVWFHSDLHKHKNWCNTSKRNLTVLCHRT